MTNSGEQHEHVEFRVDEDDLYRWGIHLGFGLIGFVVGSGVSPSGAVSGFFIGVWLSSFIHKTVRVEDGKVVFRPGKAMDRRWLPDE